MARKSRIKTPIAEQAPTTTLVSIVTPKASILAISCLTIFFGNRNSGMP